MKNFKQRVPKHDLGINWLDKLAVVLKTKYERNTLNLSVPCYVLKKLRWTSYNDCNNSPESTCKAVWFFLHTIIKNRCPLCYTTANTNSVAKVVCNISRGVAPYKIYPLYTASVSTQTQMTILHSQAALKRRSGTQWTNISSGSLRAHDDGGCRETPDGESTRHSVEEQSPS